MDDWFNVLSSSSALAPDDRRRLLEDGFVVVAGPLPADVLPELSRAYDAAMTSAKPADVHVGTTTTRVTDFVNRGPAFDALYLDGPALEASCRVIERPFRLSTMHARTVRPHTPAQALHVDFARLADGWPMVGFIFMVDGFRPENGATRFLPGSHDWSEGLADLAGQTAEADGTIAACGPAGSMILFNGSVWHGHGSNASSEPRRSIQGAYIRREEPSGVNLAARMLPETLARIGPLARYLLAV